MEKRNIGGDYRETIIVAEAGTAHNGDLSKAERLIAAASECGADYVKFQYVIADEILHPKTDAVELPGGLIPLFKRFKELERPPGFYEELIKLCDKHGVSFLCAAFGLESAENLYRLGVKSLKIASPELNHTPLLREAGSFGIPIVLSSGVSTISDIDYALSTVNNAEILLHCVTAYPAPETEYNLNLLPHLSSLFGIACGVSDHSLNEELVPVLSTTVNAKMIEKHFTLSNEDDGLDDKIALAPESFKRMAAAVRKSEKKRPEEVIDELTEKYGEEKVRAVLGNGGKKPAASELGNYKTTRRSVLARNDIKKGSFASYQNCGVYRSEKNLLPGMAPALFESFLGREFAKPLKSGDPVLIDCFF